MGLSVTLHSHGEFPQPQTEGISVMPGHSTDISYTIEHTEGLSQPYGDCIRNTSLEGLSGFSYSPTPCSVICRQERTVHECGCPSVYGVVPDDYKNMAYCGTFKDDNDTIALETVIKETECETSVWLEFGNSASLRDGCGCSPQCSHTTYVSQVAECQWPAPKYYQSFIEQEILSRVDYGDHKVHEQLWKTIDNCASNDTGSKNYDFISENFARVNVFLRVLEIIEMTQTPAYNLSNLFSDMGGTLGLWVGVSILTVAELIQLVIRMGLTLCNRNRPAPEKNIK